MAEPALTITLPYLPPEEYSANRARGRAWQRQYRASHGRRGAVSEVIGLVKEQGWSGPPLEQARVEVEFVLPDEGRRDGLGLLERLKPWLDGLVAARVLADDDLKTIGWPAPQHRYEKGRAMTRITVWRNDGRGD